MEIGSNLFFLPCTNFTRFFFTTVERNFLKKMPHTRVALWLEMFHWIGEHLDVLPLLGGHTARRQQMSSPREHPPPPPSQHCRSTRFQLPEISFFKKKTDAFNGDAARPWLRADPPELKRNVCRLVKTAPMAFHELWFRWNRGLGWAVRLPNVAPAGPATAEWMKFSLKFSSNFSKENCQRFP